MFVRKLSVHLKPDTLGQFTSILENEIVPVLRKQHGFKDEIALAIPGSRDVLSISFWDNQKNAETYESNTYKDVLKMVSSVIDGTPKLETTEVLHSTLSDLRKPVAA
ncbi:MAG TPA: hypothetical protein VJV96_10465 [Candidatus Angelobacter sp.]|nr:hypothetical protein [Candidatus Angelobacter sp.]